MSALSRDLRRALERAVRKARAAAEAGAGKMKLGGGEEK